MLESDLGCRMIKMCQVQGFMDAVLELISRGAEQVGEHYLTLLLIILLNQIYFKYWT